MANDANLFFNMITGYSMIQSMRRLVVAPISLKFRLIELIDREAKRAAQGYSGRIMAKMNALADIDVINALYRASEAGVKVDLNIRGVCMLIPGVPGLSENIRVISIIDRYLEHSRIFYFANGGAEEVYLSSADWMSRNLERRVELMFPLIQEQIKTQVMEILRTYFLDTTHALSLNKDGSWTPVLPSSDLPPLRAQEVLYQAIRDRSETYKAAPRQEFIVRRRPAAE
jgi:polyphosphate kinase